MVEQAPVSKRTGDWIARKDDRYSAGSHLWGLDTLSPSATTTRSNGRSRLPWLWRGRQPVVLTSTPRRKLPSLVGLDAGAEDSRLGKLSGLVSFIAEEFFSRGEFPGYCRPRAGLALNAGASLCRYEGARSGSQSFSCGLHLRSRCSGCWPARWLDTRVGIPPVRLVNKHVSSMLKHALDLPPPGPAPASSGEGVTQPQVLRRRGVGQE